MTKFFFVTLFAHGLAIVHRNILIADAWLRIKFIQILVSYDLRRVEIIKKMFNSHSSTHFEFVCSRGGPMPSREDVADYFW